MPLMKRYHIFHSIRNKIYLNQFEMKYRICYWQMSATKNAMFLEQKKTKHYYCETSKFEHGHYIYLLFNGKGLKKTYLTVRDRPLL